MKWYERRVWELVNKRHSAWPVNYFIVDLRRSMSKRLIALVDK